MTLEQTLDNAKPSTAQILGPAAALLFVIGFVAAGADSQTVWYVIRASGIIAYGLLAIAVTAGLLITNRALPSGRPRVDLFEVHTFTSLLALAFTGVHGVGLLLDTYIGFAPSQILIPFTSSYRPFGVGIGIIGLYIAGTVYASFWLRKRIGYRTWRTLHYASFLAFTLAALHGVLSGTDSGTEWMTFTYAATTAAVVGLTLWRISTARAKQRHHATG